MSGWITGIAFGAMIGVVMGMTCNVPKALITAISVIATILLAPQMIEDWENGDYDLAVAGGLQILSSLSMIFMQCFTGNTLVATKDGDKRIDELCVGDSVWAEDTVTGEKVLKEVVKVYVKETDHLIHIGTSTGEDIETTENHPFYVDGRGWVAASELEEGETLHTEDGSVVTVTYNQDEWLKQPVKVYNLEVEGLHTYYVTADRVLVHNEYSVLDDDALVVRGGQSSPENLATNQAADSRGHIWPIQQDVRALLNEAGRITDKYRYNAYGELIEKTGDTENHYLYTGEYYDSTSNLYYLRARYMNPSTGILIM